MLRRAHREASSLAGFLKCPSLAGSQVSPEGTDPREASVETDPTESKEDARASIEVEGGAKWLS
jgi:hypothetical protein